MAGAKEVAGCITSALTSAAADMAVSKLIENLNMQMPVAEKLQRLEMLLIKIHSAVEAAEKHTIENTWLLQWRNKLKEAALAGDDVLASFRQRAMEVQTKSNVDQQQQNGSSTWSSPSDVNTGSLSFTRNAMVGILQGIRGASKMFSSNEDSKVLSNTVKNLEQLSSDIGEFIRLLQLEVSLKAEQRPTEKMDKPNVKKIRRLAVKTQYFIDCGPTMVAYETREAAENAMVVTQEEQRGEVLLSKLKKALAEISKTVEQADSRNLRDRKWLASWADILRDAKKQGCAALDAIRASTMVDSPKAGKETTVEFEQENELTRFVCTMESLAEEVIYFGSLVRLCPY